MCRVREGRGGEGRVGVGGGRGGNEQEGAAS